jgi:hypothetical protein
MDVNVIKCKCHKPSSLKKLKKTLDREFEYVDNEFSLVGFKNVMKRWLKIERSKLKIRFMAGKKDCHVNIEPLLSLGKVKRTLVKT